MSFEPTIVDNDVRNKFINNATKLNLNTILKTNAKKLRISFYKSTTVVDVFMVMITCMYDSLLIKLANEYGFPRGFPILWSPCGDPDETIQYFGFYPKFSNDDHQDVNEILECFNVSFLKKWSGFLSQLVVFEINGNRYWTVTSKNSANCNSKFIKEASRLYEPHITKTLIDRMIQDGLHLCSETMSFCDQVHGARVLKETIVVTCIGKRDQKKFVNFMENIDLVKFCQEFNLPCDTNIYIDNKETATQFMRTLHSTRDMMTNSMFENILDNTPNIIRTHGTINHSDILGDCLEGLVLRVNTPDGEKILKYKFPKYVVRTMGLRNTFDNNIDPIDIQADRFVNHWCVSDEGKKYWKNFFIQGRMLHKSKNLTLDPNVGEHIQISEALEAGNYPQESHETYDATIIVCTGPIGSGKTTFANILEQNIDNGIHIDGDDICEYIPTHLLQGERNPYTIWRIVDALMRGLVPIISSGGGAIQNIKEINNTLGIQCKIILCIPQNESLDVADLYNDVHLSRNAIEYRIKNNIWSAPLDVNKIIERSKKNIIFAKELSKQACMVIRFPIVTPDNHDVYASYAPLCSAALEVCSNVQQMSQIPTVGSFKQVRLLVRINVEHGERSSETSQMTRHITCSYNEYGTEYSLDDINKNMTMYESTIQSNIITVKSIDNKNQYRYIILPTLNDKITPKHITIYCGKHYPQDTCKFVESQNSTPIIDIATKDGHVIQYDIRTCTLTPCTIKILSSFGI